MGLEIIGVPAREGCKIFDVNGTDEIGELCPDKHPSSVLKTGPGIVTSGIPSPTLGTNIAMGYVTSGHHKKGTNVLVEVRKKLRDAVVRPMPFVPPKYYK